CLRSCFVLGIHRGANLPTSPGVNGLAICGEAVAHLSGSLSFLANSGTLVGDDQFIAPARGAVRQNQVWFGEEAEDAPPVDRSRHHAIAIRQIGLAVIPRRPLGLLGLLGPFGLTRYLCVHVLTPHSTGGRCRTMAVGSFVL